MISQKIIVNYHCCRFASQELLFEISRFARKLVDLICPVFRIWRDKVQCSAYGYTYTGIRKLLVNNRFIFSYSQNAKLYLLSKNAFWDIFVYRICQFGNSIFTSSLRVSQTEKTVSEANFYFVICLWKFPFDVFHCCFLLWVPFVDAHFKVSLYTFIAVFLCNGVN